MKDILLNGNQSVKIEIKEDKTKNVYINGKKYDFKEDDNPNKEDYAHGVKRKLYQEFLNNQFENLIVLTGAGSSIGIGEEGKKGKVLTQLWDDAIKELGENDFNILCELINYKEKNEDGTLIKNLEYLLSLAITAQNYITSEKIDIKKTIKKIKKLIKNGCTLNLPEHSPHTLFLNKLTKRKVTLPRFKLFTLNYDTLFEQAGKKGNYTIIDGFSFSLPRIFSGRNFDFDIVSRSNSRVKEEDNFVSKVFHLYKLHGSIDWSKSINGEITQSDDSDKSLMIYPNQNKYESSYEQPYFEMMSRFQQSLRSDNVLLISIGFSFGDKHIVTAIKEALEQNPSFQLMIINKGIDYENKNLLPFIEAAKNYNSVFIIDETFESFAENYPDLKSYNQEENKKIILNVNNTTIDES